MQENAIADLAQIKARRSLGKQLGLRRGDALLVVDMQRDFLPGGRLAVPRADEIIAPINAYLATFAERELPIVLSRDWHPAGHCSFKDAGGQWPAHCIQGTAGAEWAEGLRIPASACVISKATETDIETNSAFAGTALLAVLKAKHVTRIFVAGVATDYCVHATVLSARSHGFGVVVLMDAVRGLNREHGDESRTLREMMECGATFFERSHGPATHARIAPPAEHVVYTIGDYGFGIEVTLPFADAVARVIQALQNEGFGVISDVDIAATMHTKLGTSMNPYRILGACNPTLAHRALAAQPSVGLLLPCNVVVRRDDRGSVHIEFMDPNVLSDLINHPDIVEIAQEVRRKLRRVVAWI